MRLGLDLLRVTESLLNDQALIGALHSPLTGLTVDELSEIRLSCREGSFSEAFLAFTEDGEGELAARAKAFRQTVERWSLLAGSLSLGTLSRRIFDESGLSAFAGALADGEQRTANLNRLTQMAQTFDSGASGSLTRFLFDIEQSMEKKKGESPQIVSENDDVVRLMTIHKSKGLEFPVVIGAKLDHRQNLKPVLTCQGLGLAMDYYDQKLRAKRKTLASKAINLQNRFEDAQEELRILYVLLTRAKSRLILTSTVKGFDKAQEKWNTLADNLSASITPLDTIMAARTLAEREGAEVFSTVCAHTMADLYDSSRDAPTKEDLARMTLADAMRHPEHRADPKLSEALRWNLPGADDANRPLKLTVTGLEREVTGPDVVETMVARPAFMAEEDAQTMTGTERGTAYHRMLELIDYDTLDDAHLLFSVKEQMQASLRKRLLTEAQAEAINPYRIVRFLESPIGRRLRAAETVRREWSFNLRLRADEALTPEEAGRFGGKELLVQGTIDCCFMEDGQWVLVDYKTNRTQDFEAIRAQYMTQVRVYALALERITGIPVKEKVLYMTSSGEAVIM